MNAREFNGALRVMTQLMMGVETAQDSATVLATMFDRLMTADEVAELRQVSRRTVLHWIEKGQIPAVKKGSTFFVLRADAMKFNPPPRGNPAWADPANR